MDNWFNRLVVQSNGRPFTLDEAERIAEFAESLPDRLAAAKRLEESQKWLAKQLSDVVAPKAHSWGLPKDPFTNDFTQTLSAIAQAMLLDDTAMLDQSVIAPFNTLAEALDIPSDELGGLYTIAWEALSRRLDPKSVTLFLPYFSYTARGLQASDFESMIETPMPAFTTAALTV